VRRTTTTTTTARAKCRRSRGSSTAASSLRTAAIHSSPDRATSVSGASVAVRQR
jgi:hypothetical protein